MNTRDYGGRAVTKEEDSVATDRLNDFDRDTFTDRGVTHGVYRKGTGPGVVVITEAPGITPDVADFARLVVDRGFTVAMPDLFGEAGRPFSLPYVAQTMVRVCVSREFTLFARRKASPITVWLRALGRDLHRRAGGPGIGAIGMCLTGGFALAMAVDPTLLAPVLSQPSLPFAATPAHARDPGIPDADLEVVRRRCEDEGLCVLGLRFRGDMLSPGARFGRLAEELGDSFVGIQLDGSDANPEPRPLPPHSVVTRDLVDEPGQPTYDARERVLQLFEERLLTAA